MGNIFAGSDVVELGIEIEKNGKDFYNTLTNQSKNKKAKDMFKYLANEEEKHIIVFQGILDKVKQDEPADSYPGEYLSYMNALASEYVFTKAGKGIAVARGIKNDLQAVDAGIGLEKDSILFYEGMKKMVPDYEYKTIDELILQEQDHLRKLYELKSNM